MSLEERAQLPVGAHMNAPTEDVTHAALTRTCGDTAYRSNCPHCIVGVLPVRREQETLQLLDFDRCTWCGQVFRYTDTTINGEPLRKVGA